MYAAIMNCVLPPYMVDDDTHQIQFVEITAALLLRVNLYGNTTKLGGLTDDSITSKVIKHFSYNISQI